MSLLDAFGLPLNITSVNKTFAFGEGSSFDADCHHEFCRPREDAAMRDGTLGSITSRDEFIIAEALATALVALEELPPTRQPTRNIADMKMLLNSL
jgi:hypothetical protein